MSASYSCPVPINQIRELRLGQPPTDNVNASRWITVVYVRSSQWKVLHMIALTDDVYGLWVDTLSRLVSETSDRMVGHGTPSDPDTAWIKQLWPVGAKEIDWGVAVGLCRSIGLAVPQERDLAQVSNRGCGVFTVPTTRVRSIWTDFEVWYRIFSPDQTSRCCTAN